MISVIIPYFNTQEFIGECFFSIKEQTFQDFEIIAVNDGSSDDSENIIKKIFRDDPRLICVNNNKKGVSSARNLGLEKSNRKYIKFFDSDDKIDPDFFKLSINFLNSNPNINLVHGVNYFISSDGFDLKQKHGLSRTIELKDTIFGNPAHLNTLLIRKSCINNILFNESLRIGEDFIFLTKLLEKNNSFYNKKLISFYRVNKDSTIRNDLWEWENEVTGLIYANIKNYEILKNTKIEEIVRDSIFFERYLRLIVIFCLDKDVQKTETFEKFFFLNRDYLKNKNFISEKILELKLKKVFTYFSVNKLFNSKYINNKMIQQILERLQILKKLNLIDDYFYKRAINIFK